CGSADLLEAAGIPLDLAPEQALTVLHEVGITFLFAPRYHPAMRFAAPVRRALGVRTIFNFLGPLCNPGRVRRQLLGVGERERVPDFVQALGGLGVERGFVVHGGGGADELTLEDGNLAVPVGNAPSEPFDPAGLGFSRAGVAALEGGDAARNLALLQGILDGEAGPLRDAVLLNAAAALAVAGVAADAADGVARAREALDSGRARRTLSDWSSTAASLARGVA
ncbi:MAG: anthranilate phosphoribosyltransferase, partial [Planctomycetota bacterium]